MRPYYEHGGITIYHGDCRQVLLGLSPAELVVTDPPYGISDVPLLGNRGGTNTWHPASDWDRVIDPEWCRMACSFAPIVAWFGHWRKRTQIEAVMTHPLRGEIVWAKDTHVGHACPVAMRDERIWLFSATGIRGRRFETSVWDEPIIPTWSFKWHKNQKPLNLMQRLLSWLPLGTVCDPFMGSGTTLLAAKNLGQTAVGIEISERFCEMAAQRLSQEVLDLGVVA